MTSRSEKDLKKKGGRAASDGYGSARRSYHGNYASYQTNEQGEEVCYFNPCYKRERLEPSQFRYLFKDLVTDSSNRLDERLDTVQRLIDLADAMVDEERAEQSDQEGHGNSDIPAGYTYWGQFIDHDLSAGTDRSHEFEITRPNFNPVPPSQVEDDIENMRTPYFDLDSLYGDEDGAFSDMNRHLYQGGARLTPKQARKRKPSGDLDPIKFIIGETVIAGQGVTPDEEELGNQRDLPRNAAVLDGEDERVLPEQLPSQALIGDFRNDENLIVAQFHLAMLKFHNEMVDAVREDHPDIADDNKKVFEEARRQVTWHYQWLVVNDFLGQIVSDDELQRATDSPSIFEGEEKPFMPLEFSTAAYRFGHTMVRNLYDYNLNFGRGLSPLIERAPFDLLFAFTGRGAVENERMDVQLPNNWIIQWERFFDVKGALDQNQKLITDRFARGLDTNLAEALTSSGMQNESFRFLGDENQAQVEESGVSPTRFNQIMRHLARRNLLRGYLLSMPTGQALANAAGVDVMSAEELKQGGGAAADLLADGDFVDETPLWFYILKEAEVKGKANRLGPLGSFLVARTFLGLLKSDPNSYLNAEGGAWSPKDGIVDRRRPDGFKKIMDLLRFARVALDPSFVV